MKLKKTPYFWFNCLICGQKIEGYLNYLEEKCTHYYLLGNDNDSKWLPVCLDCGKPIFHKLETGKVIFFERATSPIFLDANDLTINPVIFREN